MKKLEDGKDFTVVTWDWKRGPDIAELVWALKPFGIFVCPDPACDGTDANGVVFSNRELTDDDLEEINSY